MRFTTTTGSLAVGVLVSFLNVAQAIPVRDYICPKDITLVPERLDMNIEEKSILKHMSNLDRIARQVPRGDRLAGSVGSNETIKYIQDQLTLTGYDVELLPFVHKIHAAGEAQFSVGEEVLDVTQILWSPDANYTDLRIIPVENAGCAEEDYPPTVFDQIVLVPGGNCTTSEKSSAAKRAGAAALVIYESTELTPSLGGEDSSHIPSMKISLNDGLALASAKATDIELRGNITSWKEVETIYSANVIASSDCPKDKKTLILGAHSDSVADSPGMNDNGSGVAALLEVATQLYNYRTKSRVQFAFWTAGQSGQLGAQAWVNSASGEDLDNTRLYLDVGMVGSSNGFVQLYGGTNSMTGLPGPDGSGEARNVFSEWFAEQGIPFRHTDFSGRSDYEPFLEAGVPCAGIFAGADGLKSAWEAENYGGAADEPYDPYYHTDEDTLENIDSMLLFENTRAVAYVVAQYAREPGLGASGAMGFARLLSYPVVLTMVFG